MRLSVMALLLAIAACAPVQDADVTMARPIDVTRVAAFPPAPKLVARAAVGPTRSNSDIAADFMDLEFNLESGRSLPILTRFDGPVSVAMRGNVPPTAAKDLDKLITRLRAEAGIDIARAQDPNASIAIEFVPRRQMQAIVPSAACFVAPRVTSWADYRMARHTSVLDWTTLHERNHMAIFIPSDTSPQEVRDCLHEELAQALGPLNDLYRLSDSVFNDDNFQSVLTGFDMLVLRLHYSAQLQNGMTPAQVSARLPALLATINPMGEKITSRTTGGNSRPWIDLIETALGPTGADQARLKAAEKALLIAQNGGWSDNRLALSYFTVGLLSLGKNVPHAISCFFQASRLYQTSPDSAIHVAHVDMQMAALALSAGQPDATIALADKSIPAAVHAQNTALLATLMLLKAQALDQLGRADEAQAVRLDSLGWARYGFGSESDVRARIVEIAALSSQ